jgi:hypothetical protein
MQLQTKAREALAQLRQEPLCLNTMLEPNDEVIRPGHHDHIAARLLVSPSLDPQVEQDGRDES